MERMSQRLAVIQDPLEAARRLAYDFKGGIAALARLLGRNPQVLAHQLNPEQEHHNLGLATAIAMTEAADDERILDAWAAQRGKVVIALPEGSVGEEELFDEVLKLGVLQGDFANQLVKARSDGVIDPTENLVLVALLRRFQQQTANIEQGIGAQVRSLPPVRSAP